MKYNKLGNTGLMVSEIALGCEHLEGKDYPIVEETINAALDAGINLLDVFMSEPQVRSDIGRALKGRRKNVMLQGHFRTVWKDNQYGRTLNIDEVKFFFEDLLNRLGTDYIDLGMLHIMDNEAEFREVFEGEILQYALSLKEQGVIKHLGISSHVPATALKAVKTGLVETMMFSINPVYDLLAEDSLRPKELNNEFFADADDVNGINETRAQLYKTCEAMGVGITSMKTFAAGALLDARKSPFGRAMTVGQCIHYALNRPAVASVMAGLQSAEQVAQAVAYGKLSDEDKDYTEVLSLDPKFSLQGRCMYCNHCLPCTAHINIAEVNKYLDLAELDGEVPPSVREHYDSLDVTAQACIGCGACEANCPFSVPVINRMRRATDVFGK